MSCTGVRITPMPPHSDWLETVLFERGYLARIKGDAIKVYLVLVAAGGGKPDRSVRMSLSQMMASTRLTCPTVLDALARLEKLGLVVSTTRETGRAKTYYISDPPPASPE
jgi:DNA-binding MarR family transcriptional regulator